MHHNFAKYQNIKKLTQNNGTSDQRPVYMYSTMQINDHILLSISGALAELECPAFPEHSAKSCGEIAGLKPGYSGA